MKKLFEIDKSKQIFYSTTDLFKVLDETGEPFYQTEITIPIKFIGEVKATEIQLLGTTLNWFAPHEIRIINESIVIHAEDPKTQDWQRNKDLDVSFTPIVTIKTRNNEPINKDNFVFSVCDKSFEGLEKDIITAIMTEIIPRVSDNKTYEETWQLKVSKIEDQKLWKKLFMYKTTRNLTTSKALRELLNFAFLCLKNGFMVHPNNPRILIKNESIDSWSRRPTHGRKFISTEKGIAEIINEDSIETKPYKYISSDLDSVIEPIKNAITNETKKLIDQFLVERGLDFVQSSIAYAMSHQSVHVLSRFDKYLHETLINGWAPLKSANLINKIKEEKKRKKQALNKTQAKE